MKIQEHMIDVTREAAEEVFRYAKAVPEDKANWKPLDEGRSVLEIARELAMCPHWAWELISGKELDFSEESQEAQGKEMNSWGSVADCEKACQEKLGTLFELYKNLPDERLKETKTLPFGPGGSMKEFTMVEMMDYPRWNFNYHLGQIGYIQILYGDRQMH